MEVADEAPQQGPIWLCSDRPAGRVCRAVRLDPGADEIATITLDRPDHLNAFTGTMRRELIDAFDRSDADDDVRAVTELVALHLRFHTYRLGWSDSAVRRYVRDAGDLLTELNVLTRCDCTTRNERKARTLSKRSGPIRSSRVLPSW
mgnify:CR=1 FL=1